jgi:hypothetical protein
MVESGRVDGGRNWQLKSSILVDLLIAIVVKCAAKLVSK